MKLNVEAVIFVHRLFFEDTVKKGGIDFVLEELQKRNKKILLVESSLVYEMTKYTKVSLVHGTKVEELSRVRTFFLHSTISWFIEVLYFSYVVLKYRIKNVVCITSDPLTTLGGVIIRKLGLAKYLYFHLTDYSTVRFDNKILNKIYRIILIFSLKHSDLVGCVSNLAKKEVEQFNYKGTFYIPNSRDYDSDAQFRKPVNQRKEKSLLFICAAIAPRYSVYEVVEQVAKLTVNHPDLVLNILGSVEFDPDYVNKLRAFILQNKLENNIIIKGFMPRDECTELLSTTWIGLAFYNPEYSFQKYGDSLKVREAASLGVPTIMDSLVTSTTSEVIKYNAGIVLKELDKLPDALDKVFSDRAYYELLSSNALKWSKDLDKKVILDKLLRKLKLV